MCYEPQTEQEAEQIIESEMKLGDMLYHPQTQLWYTMGLANRNDPETLALFPNIIMDEPLEPLTRWGVERKTYLEEHNPHLVAQMGIVGLHKHCLEIQQQAQQQIEQMTNKFKQNPDNKVTERDKAFDQMAWVQRMNSFRDGLYEAIREELILAPRRNTVNE